MYPRGEHIKELFKTGGISMFYKGTELYQKNGKVGVLVSPGFGAGWSTWNCPQLAYDKRVIEYWLNHKKDDLLFGEEASKAEELFNSWGYKGVYFGGFKNLVLKWVVKGEPFRISEYDGFEELKMLNTDEYTVF